jgi:hypothetical protein
VTNPSGDEDLVPVKKSFFELLPRRNLVKAVLLLLILGVIIALKLRSGIIVQNLTETLNTLAPQRPATPPRVKLAPPPGSTP